MEYIKVVSKTFPWKTPLIPFLSDGKWKIPLYGPLNIENYQQYLDDGKQLFHEFHYIEFPYRISLDQFHFYHVLAVGGFGKIILAQQKNKEKSLYAMKAIEKSFLIANNCLTNVLNEKRIMQSLNCPFCIPLDYICQSSSYIYMFMPFISGGDLFTHLFRSQRFEENESKFYAAQVILALEFMQNCDVIHRDLKPENILIDRFGFVKLTDFGMAKVVARRTYTFCGTVEYAAPEVILGKGYGKAVDWWSLGVLIFEMNNGKVPFSGADELGTLEKILRSQYNMPEHFGRELRTLVRRLLERDVTKRLGNLMKGAEEVKCHEWFEGISWMDLLNRRVVPPFIPDHSTRLGEANFPNMSPLSDIRTSPPPVFDTLFKDF